jgi:hypothetical protein
MERTTISRELRKLRRRGCANSHIAWWIKGFYRALQLSGGLSLEIQQCLDEELAAINRI